MVRQDKRTCRTSDFGYKYAHSGWSINHEEAQRDVCAGEARSLQ